MRQHYFDALVDIGSSGVQDFGFGELREIIGLRNEELDRLVMRDSPTFGHDDLRRTIAERWRDGDPEWVIATHGASEAIFLAMNSILEPGDHVVALDPIYHGYETIARTVGCEVTPWRLRPETGFEPDLDELAALVTPRTKAIVVNFPHNPTGASLSVAGQRRLIETAESVGAHLVWDTALAELTYDTSPLPDPTTLYRRAISIGTLSKAFGLPGMRLGWCIASPETLAGFVTLRDAMTLHLSPLVETIGEKVIRHADRIVSRRLEQARDNLTFLAKYTADSTVLSYAPPVGGVTVFARLEGLEDTTEFCRMLSSKRRTMLVPGTAFGHSDRVRLGFGGKQSEFREGIQILGEELSLLGSNSVGGRNA
ncbi:capreomycidine synthase [Lentzea albidocapillata]|uniref:Capreomycidine synthase n=2 Tax=Lentzea albidocapillata TaxID=40571 RepID=A0A1W2CVI8_9PSEU|nr:capreomycidine synthase [Lentzea albidocapillata]